MKLKAWLIGLTVGLALCQIGVVYAEDKTEPVVKADNKDDFAVVAAAIRQQVAPGGRWEFVNRNENDTINRNLNDMQSLFDKFGTVDKMDDASKTQLFNDQESVNVILTKRDDKRLVCEQEIPVGSHLPVKACRTYGDIERERVGARRFLEDRSFMQTNTKGH